MYSTVFIFGVMFLPSRFHISSWRSSIVFLLFFLSTFLLLCVGYNTQCVDPLHGTPVSYCLIFQVPSDTLISQFGGFTLLVIMGGTGMSLLPQSIQWTELPYGIRGTYIRAIPQFSKVIINNFKSNPTIY